MRYSSLRHTREPYNTRTEASREGKERMGTGGQSDTRHYAYLTPTYSLLSLFLTLYSKCLLLTCLLYGSCYIFLRIYLV